MQLADTIKSLIREIPDFPRQGIAFKDLTPVLEYPQVSGEIASAIAGYFKDHRIDAVAAIEARGFLFGILLAQHLNIPFIPVRKEGKLPYKKINQKYNLEYGTASMEMHQDAIVPGWRVLVHDDLLATGGTAGAAALLVEALGGVVAGFSFIINLSALEGEKVLKERFACDTHYLIQY